MTFRCEICDAWLPMFQFSKLCPTCYKIRTITKCYSAKEILSTLENNFLVSAMMEQEKRKEDVEFYKNEDERLAKEALKEFNPTAEQLAKLEEQAKKVLEAQEKANEERKAQGVWDNAPLTKEYPKHFVGNDVMPPLIETEEEEEDERVPKGRKCKKK